MELGDYNIRKVKKFERVWKVGMGGSLTTSPVIHGGALYFGCADYNVYALDPDTGALIWKHRTEGPIVEGSVCIHDGTLYIGSFDHNMYALEASSGRLIWKFRTADKVASSPVIDGGLLYFGGKDHNVYALDAKSGVLAWKQKTSGGIISEAVVCGDRLIIGSYDHNLYCLDKRTGTMHWKFATQGEIHNANGFAVREGVVYFSSFDDYVRAVDIASGRLLWRHRLGIYGCTAAPVLHDDVLYCPSRNGILYAVSTEGRLLWKFTTRDNIGIPLVHEERIYVGSCDHSLHCIDMKGKEQWSFRTNGFVWWRPAIWHDKVIFGSWDCIVYCLGRNGKDLAWKFRTSGEPSLIPPANEAFELEIRISPGPKEAETGKTYQLDLTGESEEKGAFYKSRITYQVSTHYREKGKYQTTEDDF